jgi:hypothetical protein
MITQRDPGGAPGPHTRGGIQRHRTPFKTAITHGKGARPGA